MQLKNGFQLILLLVVCALSACGTSVHAPVTELRQPPLTAKTYIVQKGDTLFAIAWRFDLDYRLLAKANNIHRPYIIKPRDTIYLTESGRSKSRANNPTKNNKIAVERNKKPTRQKTTNKTGIVKRNGVEKRYKPTLQTVKNESWRWPVSGKVVRYFSPKDKLSKGIDISAKTGAPIVSSRSGEVVYAGSQLKGYGNLIIIRHDAVYLSAYAHNRKILVKEGQQVKQGHKIAELGSSGTQSPKLHFEIRRQGKPINPLKLLEKK